ncbi:MAG: SDR family oxidoreductase [Hyphomicrobiaceae bacterium]
MDMNLKDSRVIVSAGASGIGREIALAFHEEGAKVSVCDIDEGALEKLKAQMPKVQTVVCDVSDTSAAQGFVEGAADWMGGIDVLVNNAGVAGPTAPIEEVDPDDWARCINVGLTGHFNCTRIAVPHLRKSKNASIINLASAAGKYGFALRTPYSATKWGVVGFTKSLSIELGKSKIRANAILPGLVEGDRIRSVLESRAQSRGISFEEATEEAFSFVSIKDFVTARQLADLALFLASPKGCTISGQALSVDGDLRMLG